MTTTAHVYQAINEVTAIMAGEGLPKSRSAKGLTYSFRGIDDVYFALARRLADVKLCILPRVLERSMTERKTSSGGVMTYVVLDVEFDLVSAVDGSKHTIRTMGEAMDTSDKATNKAMSAAMKYACILAFQIPTEGDNDTENANHQKGSAPDLLPSSAEENAVASLFINATSTDDIAAAEARAQKAIAAKLVVNGGRERLLKLRREAMDRVSR